MGTQQQPRETGSKLGCFHDVDRDTAENLLLHQGVDRSFLVRPSASAPGDYVLCVRHENEVMHFKIQSGGEFFDLFGGEQFASLQELIEYYQKGSGTLLEKEGRVACPMHPLVNEESLRPHERSGAHMPWFHKDVTTPVAEALLKKCGQPGGYLVRPSTSQPDALVLSVMLEDKSCLHVRIFWDEAAGYDIGKGNKFSSLPELIEYYRGNDIVDKSGAIVKLIQPLNVTRPTYMKAADIGGRIAELESKGFTEEFNELQRDSDRGPGREKLEAARPENKGKNRFQNILPYDRTRVILKDCSGSDPEFGDYINANYVKPRQPNDGREYIATQGPTRTCLVDFWRMVWQENSRVILMITLEMENNKMKCAKYWPTEHKTDEFPVPGGVILVSHTEEKKSPDLTVNKFEVRHVPGSETRTVLHYHYVGWPDHKVPQKPESVLELLRDVDEASRELEAASDGPLGPVIVHCSAGIGRTGSIIVIDMLIKHISANGLDCDIDVQKLVFHVRSQRSGLVQTESQYRFLYTAVQTFVEQLQQQQVAAISTAASPAAATAAEASPVPRPRQRNSK